MKDWIMRDCERLATRIHNAGYEEGCAAAKKHYGQAGNGIAHCRRATDEERKTHGKELWGWCNCGKPIVGRWAGLANFCPWCGKVIEWEDINGMDQMH